MLSSAYESLSLLSANRNRIFSSMIRSFKLGQLSSTSRDLYYLGLKSNGRLLKSVGRKLGRSSDILLGLLVVMFSIGIPVVSFLMDLLLACRKMPIFPREVERGSLLKQSIPLGGIRRKRGLCSCLIYE